MSSPLPSPPHPSPAPPPAPDGEIRPRRLWYWVGGLVFAAFLTAGTLILVFGTSPEQPDPSPGFVVEMTSTGTVASTDAVTFEVGEGESDSWALYGSGSRVSSQGCDHVSPSGLSLSLDNLDYEFRSDDGDWRYLATLDTGEPGTHSITCAAWENAHYAVGDIGVVKTADSQLGLGVVSGILLPVAGFFLGLVTVVVTLVMRVTRKSELRRRARQWPPPPGAPGAYPYAAGHPVPPPGDATRE